MRSLWPDVRTALAMQSRRKDIRAATLPLVVQRNGMRETIQVPRTQCPIYLPTPLFPPPSILWSQNPVRGVFTSLGVKHLCGPTFEEVSKTYPGAEFVGMHLNFGPELFARTLAKIGYCAAVATVGIGAFTTTAMRDIIIGADERIGHWVGSWWKQPINGTGGGLHEIRVMLSQPNNCVHAFIRLFAQFGAPEYHVIIGPADRAYIASTNWPAKWAAKNPIEI
ncbi:MAG TPA: hypothetical protein VGN17_12280 [Bryobacteraceae bacterium]|jgi:hypothetical protein